MGEGGYGRLTMPCERMVALIGAVATLQQHLVMSAMVEGERTDEVPT